MLLGEHFWTLDFPNNGKIGRDPWARGLGRKTESRGPLMERLDGFLSYLSLSLIVYIL